MITKMKLAVATFSLAMLSACGGGSGSASSGTLRLALTDAPACGFDSVNVTVQKVRIHQSSTALDSGSGWSEIVLNPAKRIDLLTLTNGVLTELGETPLPAGKYTQMRLVLADNSVTAMANSVIPSGGTTEFELTTPSGQQSGVKINMNMDIAANQMADFVLDFDACKSVKVLGAGRSGGYLLKPQLRLIPRYVNGVQGFVDPALKATASLQKDGVTVRSTVSDDATGLFLLQPVEIGNYTLVITVDGKTTSVITDVPVAVDTVTIVNSSSTALAPSGSATGVLTGTVTTNFDTVSLRALQNFSDTSQMEVLNLPLLLGNEYSYTLPITAPEVAPYVATGPLSFTAYTSGAGQYTLQATEEDQPPKTFTPQLSVSAGSSLTTNFDYP